MPIYEFRCQKCGELSEVMQRVTDPLPRCPSCGSRRMAKAVSKTSFHLKGGGWYADLYGTPRPGAGKTEGAGKAEGAEGAVAGKVAEPKPAPAADGAAKPATPAATPAATKAEPAPKASGEASRSRSRGPRGRRR